MSGELRKKLEAEIMGNVVTRMNEMNGMVSRGTIMASVPGGSQLGAFDWGGLLSNVINKAGDVYVSKELQKTQAQLANKLAEAEAKKMLAQTELELAKAQTQKEQTALLQKQNELQQILKDIQFTNVQKWMLGGAGLLAFGLGAVKLWQYAKRPKSRAR